MKGRGKGKRELDAEERILWGKVARTIQALPGRMDDIIKWEAVPVESEPVPPAIPVPPKLSGMIQLSETPEKEGRNPAKHRHHPLERPVKRKLSKGSLELEARIDLHGLFQEAAHGALLDFIMRAHGRGLRHVLVITGKGASMGSDGVLRRAVPMWFSKPEFRFFISSYEPASRNHGGEGAFYVRLSKQRAGLP